MANTILSPNMSMPVPVVGVDPGPDWANNYNSCLSVLDQHSHAAGSGVPITQSAISLTAAATTFDSLNFNTSNAYGLRSVRFTAQSAALALATDLGCLYESGVDLYYNDGAGNQIRLTQGGSIVGTAGSITGLPSGTASASYSGGTFVWQSATSTAANMDAGSYIFRNATASSKGLTLSPPNAMATDYSLVLPAIPGTQSILSLDTSGNILASYTVDNSTLTIAANVIKVANGGITATQIAAATITGAKIAAATITGSNIASATITGSNIASGITLAGTPVVGTGIQVGSSNGTTLTSSATGLSISSPSGVIFPNGTGVAGISGNFSAGARTLAVLTAGTSTAFPIVVSAVPSNHGLMIVRGNVDAAGGISSGEGFSVTHSSTGIYQINATNSFADFPTAVATLLNDAVPGTIYVTFVNTNGAIVVTQNISGTLTNLAFRFIAIGQRGA